MMLAAGHILPALATGNAVIFKPSEYAPLSAERLVGLLHRAGVPEAVLQIAHGDGRVGDALVRSGVDQVCFTGSAAAGAQVARACGERMIPCSLELGGTDAAIVLDDAPLAHTARGLTWGRLMNAGQSCVAPKRILAMSGIHDALVAALRTEVSCAVLDGPDNGAASLGGLIRVSQAEQVGRQTDGSLAAGASEIATQVVAATGPSAVVPRLLIGIDDDMPAWSEEIFGPVLAIRRVTSVDEAITLANASLFGLSASVWSGDRARARAIASRLDAGSVVINDVVSVVGMVDVPHGGTKRSGYGRMHGDEALLECTRTHTVVDDIAPSWRNPWWFPYSSNQRDDLSRFVGLVHGASLTERLRGIGAAIRLLLGPR
jgi:betaine-aldehyde dehydrogenase